MGIGWANILTFSLSRFWQWGILSNFCSYHFWEWKVSKMNGEDEKWSTSACFPVFTLRSVQFKTFSYTKARVLQDRNWASYRYAQFWKERRTCVLNNHQKDSRTQWSRIPQKLPKNTLFEIFIFVLKINFDFPRFWTF